MTPEIILAAVSMVSSLVALTVSILRGNTLKEEAKATAKDTLGKRYAALAWAYAEKQPDSVDSVKGRKHALEAFVLADTSADGKRDFNDTQVRAYIDAHR